MFGAVQFTLPCGENKIFSEIVGIGEQVIIIILVIIIIILVLFIYLLIN